MLYLVACGRDHTLVATRPYGGLSKALLEEQGMEKNAIQEAIERAEDIEEAKLEGLQDEMDMEMIELGLAALNKASPMCGSCEQDSACRGFEKDATLPRSCKNCLHDLRKHNKLRKSSDATFSIEYTNALLRDFNINVDFGPILLKYPMLNTE